MRINDLRINNANNAFKILNKLKKYKNVFLIKEINRLSFYENYKYIIKITTKSLFDSLYNFFNIKLTTLRNYFNNTLTKN